MRSGLGIGMAKTLQNTTKEKMELELQSGAFLQKEKMRRGGSEGEERKEGKGRGEWREREKRRGEEERGR